MLRVPAAAFVVSTLAALAAGPVAAQSPVDADALRSRCEANAPAGAERDTCLRMVDTYLLTEPATSPTPAPSVTAGAVVVSGSGDENSEAFELARGDYRVVIESTATDWQCVTHTYLTETSSDANSGEVVLYVPAGETRNQETFLYRVDKGRYYWQSIFGCDHWTLSMMPVELEVAPASPDGVTVSGQGSRTTTPFALKAGDYVADWRLTADGDSCSIRAELEPIDESYGDDDLSGDAEDGETATGDNRFFGVEKGAYFWDVDTDASGGDWGATCAWDLTLTPA